MRAIFTTFERPLIGTLCTLLCPTVVCIAAVADPTIVLKPADVWIGPAYTGEKVSLQMETPQGYDIVVKVVGCFEELDLERKGQVGGFLWKNVGEVHFEDVPNLYFIRSSWVLDSISDGGLFERELIGYNRLSEIAGGDDASFFGELVKLKEKEGLYSVVEGSVDIRPVSNGNQEVSADFTFPAKAPPGDYSVEVFGFKGGRGVTFGARTVHIHLSPTVSFVTTLARDHGLLYGCLAVVFAVGTGLLTGVVFGIGKGKAH